MNFIFCLYLQSTPQKNTFYCSNYALYYVVHYYFRMLHYYYIYYKRMLGDSLRFFKACNAKARSQE